MASDAKIKTKALMDEKRTDHMENNQPKTKLKYTVMLVPNNAHRIKQFQISFDFVLFLSILLFALLFAGVTYVTYSASYVETMEDKIVEKDKELKNISDENILLQANIEELNNSLKEAKLTIDAKNSAKEQLDEEASKLYIPSGFPMDGTVALPSEYSEETQYVVFQASEGTKIVASGDGTIISVTPNANYGYEVQVDHGNGYLSYYFNESEPIVSEGDKVIRGTSLFIINSDDQKLIYQITFNNQFIDPMSVIEIKG